MANMFKCALAGGGDGADLIVTCSSNFAGSVITCTDGISYTKTQTCPSSSPYEVTFESIPTGTYTISGVVSGQTFSTTKTILDFDAELRDIPDGATVTPTDDIQIWLNCADIWNLSYTTLNEVLADASTLQALIASNNAADYMARSTTWASSVVANQSAMSYIGLDDYCAERLLADSTWLTAICNSTYFESVLNVKVPTMTSNVTPSGTAFADSEATTNEAAWKAFDGNDDTQWTTTIKSASSCYIGYTFPNDVKIYVGEIYNRHDSVEGTKYGIRTCKLQAQINNVWSDISDTLTINQNAKTKFLINSERSYANYKIQVLTNYGKDRVSVATIQFYGR